MELPPPIVEVKQDNTYARKLVLESARVDTAYYRSTISRGGDETTARQSAVNPDPAPAGNAAKATPPSAKESTMSDNVTRDELRLHIDLLEQKAETRQAVTDGKLELIATSIQTLATSVGDLKTQAANAAQAVKEDYKNTRNTIVGFALGSGGIVLAITALAYAAQGNMTTANGNVLSAFGAGKEAAAAEAAAEKAGTRPVLYQFNEKTRRMEPVTQ